MKRYGTWTRNWTRSTIAAAVFTLVAGCGASSNAQDQVTPPPTSGSSPQGSPAPSATRTAADGRPFQVEQIGELDSPWAMTFLPDGRALITEKAGKLKLRATDGQLSDVSGVPEVVDEGQGGFGDVVLAPDFASSKRVFLSWAEAGAGGTGAAVGRATLNTDGGSARLDDLAVVWRQEPKVSGSGQFGHRLAFSPDGRYLFVSSGERQKLTPAQDLNSALGKIIRLNADGSTAAGNPFADRGGVAAQVWTLGHRNPLGIAFDADGNLWSSEMGPMGGDEVNLIREGANYGWPEVSNGSQYGGADIPDHADGDGFEPPKVFWNPSVSPGSLMIYTGSMFPQWRGDLFLGALSAQGLIRLDRNGTDVAKGDQWSFDQRVREVEQAPDGAIWLLTDQGKLLRLSAP